ncbi:MAG TPA: hypothetical protein VGE38_16835 [Nocardioides sp.]|uniref:hypothetical protein n=1 Tax=Nocardioides sp. TaxID=35761 RepID=UPI002EDB802B
MRTAAPEFRASVEALAGVLQKRNGLAAVVAPSTLEASDAEEGPHTEPLGPEVAWTAAEGIMRVQALDLELRRMRRLNNRGAVNTENVRMLGVALKDAERAVSSFVGRSVTGEAMWKRGGPDKVEEREAKLDRYGPRRHEITVAARSRDA